MPEKLSENLEEEEVIDSEVVESEETIAEDTPVEQVIDAEIIEDGEPIEDGLPEEDSVEEIEVEKKPNNDAYTISTKDFKDTRGIAKDDLLRNLKDEEFLSKIKDGTWIIDTKDPLIVSVINSIIPTPKNTIILDDKYYREDQLADDKLSYNYSNPAFGSIKIPVTPGQKALSRNGLLEMSKPSIVYDEQYTSRNILKEQTAEIDALDIEINNIQEKINKLQPKSEDTDYVNDIVFSSAPENNGEEVSLQYAEQGILQKKRADAISMHSSALEANNNIVHADQGARYYVGNTELTRSKMYDYIIGFEGVEDQKKVSQDGTDDNIKINKDPLLSNFYNSQLTAAKTGKWENRGLAFAGTTKEILYDAFQKKKAEVLQLVAKTPLLNSEEAALLASISLDGNMAISEEGEVAIRLANEASKKGKKYEEVFLNSYANAIAKQTEELRGLQQVKSYDAIDLILKGEMGGAVEEINNMSIASLPYTLTALGGWAGIAVLATSVQTNTYYDLVGKGATPEAAFDASVSTALVETIDGIVFKTGLSRSLKAVSNNVKNIGIKAGLSKIAKANLVKSVLTNISTEFATEFPQGTTTELIRQAALNEDINLDKAFRLGAIEALSSGPTSMVMSTPVLAKLLYNPIAKSKEINALEALLGEMLIKSLNPSNSTQRDALIAQAKSSVKTLLKYRKDYEAVSDNATEAEKKILIELTQEQLVLENTLDNPDIALTEDQKTILEDQIGDNKFSKDKIIKEIQDKIIGDTRTSKAALQEGGARALERIKDRIAKRDEEATEKSKKREAELRPLINERYDLSKEEGNESRINEINKEIEKIGGWKKSLDSTKKIAEEEGKKLGISFEFQEFQTAEEVEIFIKEQIKLGVLPKGIDPKAASGSQGFNYKNKLTGKNVIVINKDQASLDGAVNIAAHEFLHPILNNAFSKDESANIKLAEALLTALESKDFIKLLEGRGVTGELLQRLKQYYSKNSKGEFENSEKVRAQEVFTLLSDALANNTLQYDETLFTKLQDIIRRFLQNMGVDIKFDSPEDVYNFVKDYNASIKRGSFTKAQQKFAKGEFKIGKNISEEKSDKLNKYFERGPGTERVIEAISRERNEGLQFSKALTSTQAEEMAVLTEKENALDNKLIEQSITQEDYDAKRDAIWQRMDAIEAVAGEEETVVAKDGKTEVPKQKYVYEKGSKKDKLDKRKLTEESEKQLQSDIVSYQKLLREEVLEHGKKYGDQIARLQQKRRDLNKPKSLFRIQPSKAEKAKKLNDIAAKLKQLEFRPSADLNKSSNEIRAAVAPVIDSFANKRTKDLYDKISGEAKAVTTRDMFKSTIENDLFSMLLREYNPAKTDANTVEKFIINRGYQRSKDIAQRSGIESIEDGGGIKKNILDIKGLSNEQSEGYFNREQDEIELGNINPRLIKVADRIFRADSDLLNDAKESVKQKINELGTSEKFGKEELRIRYMPNLVAEELSYVYFLPEKKILDPKGAPNSDEATAARNVLVDQADWIIKILPDGATKGTNEGDSDFKATNLPNNLLKTFYNKADRSSISAGLAPFVRKDNITKEQFFEFIGFKGNKEKRIGSKDSEARNVKSTVGLLGRLSTNQLVRQIATESLESDNIIFSETEIEKIGLGKNPLMFSKAELREIAEFRKSMTFGKLLEETTGIPEGLKMSERASALMAKRNNFIRKLFDDPTADDFQGLMDWNLTKGQTGVMQREWLNSKVYDPYVVGVHALLQISHDVTARATKIGKDFNITQQDLNKKLEGSPDMTVEQAVRYKIFSFGAESDGDALPGENNKGDIRKYNNFLNDPENIKFLEYATAIFNIPTIQEYGYAKATGKWWYGNIAQDLSKTVRGPVRAKILKTWKDNVDMIFTKTNYSKLEAVHGTPYVESLKAMLYSMETGKAKASIDGEPDIKIMEAWLQGSIGVIMFFNTKSAMLQMVSATNFMNMEFNNPLAAAKAFANQDQYWKDVKTLWTSAYQSERRNAMTSTINALDIKELTNQGGVMALQGKLLEKGYLPTKWADGFAIATGGASFYRNKIKALLKQNPNMPVARAEAKALSAFIEISEKTQQAARVDLTSKQQKGAIGKNILAFANTQSQYYRMMKSAYKDLINGRGNPVKNIRIILYYGLVQNIGFGLLQTGLGLLPFIPTDDDDEELINNKVASTVNGSFDTILRGMGWRGAVISTIKNIIIRLAKEKEKKQPDLNRVLIEAFTIAPAVGSKLSKGKQILYSQFKQQNKMEELSITNANNPRLLQIANSAALFGNVPADRIVKFAQAIQLQNREDVNDIQKIAAILGWSKWSLGIIDPYDLKIKQDKIAAEIQKEEKAAAKATKKLGTGGKGGSFGKSKGSLGERGGSFGTGK